MNPFQIITLTCSHLAADAFIQSDLQMRLRTIKAYLKALQKCTKPYNSVQESKGIIEARVVICLNVFKIGTMNQSSGAG